MIEAQLRNARHQRRGNDIGGIQPPAKADFDNRNISGRTRKG